MTIAANTHPSKTSARQAENNSPPKSVVEIAKELEGFAIQSARDGRSLDEMERAALDYVLTMGGTAVDLFIQHQGQGDLGETVQAADGRTLNRGSEPLPAFVRTIFKKHEFQEYAYSTGPHQPIALRPLRARMALPPTINSYLFEEFSQFFCVEEAFGRSRAGLNLVLKQDVCEDQLQAINHRLGEQAEDFLDALPIPPSAEEGEIMVLTGDGKGVPLIRQDAAKIPLTGDAPSRPGNRRMAVLAGLYTVNPFVRTPEDVLASLFRDTRPADAESEQRPKPYTKEFVARFGRDYDNGDGTTVPVNGIQGAFSWAGGRINDRRAEGQVLVRLLDGQVSLRTTSDAILESYGQKVDVDILDIIHVAA